MKTRGAVNIAEIGVRLTVGALFAAAGALKLQSPRAFASHVASFELLPLPWVPWFAAALPFFEVIVGIWILVGWRPRAAILAVLGLTTIFALALAQAMIRGLHVSCACFGAHAWGMGSPGAALLRDLGLLAAASFLFYRRSVQSSGPFGVAR